MKTKEIADFLSAELVGDGEVEIAGFAAHDRAAFGEIAFATGDLIAESAASAIIVPTSCPSSSGPVLIRTENPKLAFAKVAQKLRQYSQRYFGDGPSYIAKTADVLTDEIGAFVTIGDGSYVGESSQIGDGVKIGRNVTIKESTIIHPNCTIYDNVEIGSECVIHAGTVVGSDGFGYVTDKNGEHIQFPQTGSLVIEDNVEIGANCTIDRGSLGETRIGEGTKIDNLVHIAHNVVIGKRVLIAGQSGIAGSSRIEDDVVIAGQVGIADHVTIKAGAVIGAKSSVFPNKIIRKGFWSGIPAEPITDYRRRHAMLKKLLRETDAEIDP